MPPNHHINPRFRAYGKARIDITRRAQSEAEFQQLWRQPVNSFPFEFSNEWKFCVEYKVDDFAAEVGFYIDILGFPVIAFSPSYAQFTDPQGDFRISVASLRDGEKSTPADTLRLQFMVKDILQLAEMLEKRGIIFERKPEPIQEGSSQAVGYFRTPHGICMDLWGEIAQKPDIHDLLEEDEIDESETDRIIQRLLNLPVKEMTEDEEPLVDDEKDGPEDELLENNPPVRVETDNEKPERDPPTDPPTEGSASPTPEKSISPSRLQPGRYSGKPHNMGRPASSSNTSWKHRGNSEPTYQPIEDDSEMLDVDDL